MNFTPFLAVSLDDFDSSLFLILFFGFALAALIWLVIWLLSGLWGGSEQESTAGAAGNRDARGDADAGGNANQFSSSQGAIGGAAAVGAGASAAVSAAVSGASAAVSGVAEASADVAADATAAIDDLADSAAGAIGSDADGTDADAAPDGAAPDGGDADGDDANANVDSATVGDDSAGAGGSHGGGDASLNLAAAGSVGAVGAVGADLAIERPEGTDPDFKTSSSEEAAELFATELSGGTVKQDGIYGIIYTEAPDGADDLKEIKGVATVLEGKLNSIGVYRFKQIAVWTDEACQEFSKLLTFKNRIYTDNWIAQAKDFHEKKYGEKL